MNKLIKILLLFCMLSLPASAEVTDDQVDRYIKDLQKQLEGHLKNQRRIGKVALIVLALKP